MYAVEHFNIQIKNDLLQIDVCTESNIKLRMAYFEIERLYRINTNSNKHSVIRFWLEVSTKYYP